MKSIPQVTGKSPHLLETKYRAVLLFRRWNDAPAVCRRYHISRASLYRWNKRFDGTKNSLRDKSHRPLSPHPNAHTETELKWIRDYHRRNPNISVCELFGKLRENKGYTRHPGSLYRVFVRLGFRKQAASTKKKTKHTGKYDTPKELGIKWQMDVKYVPKACCAKKEEQQYYQYTMIEEASRERFIYPYMEQSSYSTIDFVQRAIRYFGYQPKTIQTDNGSEFTHTSKTDRVHPFDVFCKQHQIEHKLIRPRTPWHNGKVERSHRNDQERFYNYLKFYSYEDLLLQMNRYLYRANRIPMQILGWLSPVQTRKQLLYA